MPFWHATTIDNHPSCRGGVLCICGPIPIHRHNDNELPLWCVCVWERTQSHIASTSLGSHASATIHQTLYTPLRTRFMPFTTRGVVVVLFELVEFARWHTSVCRYLLGIRKVVVVWRLMEDECVVWCVCVCVFVSAVVWLETNEDDDDDADGVVWWMRCDLDRKVFCFYRFVTISFWIYISMLWLHHVSILYSHVYLFLYIYI